MDGKSDKVNSRTGNKRITLLLVLRALEQMSDEDNPIRQVTLAKMVNNIGGALNLDVWCDRKTVGRHIKLLTAAGYHIVVVKGKGCYLKSNKFTRTESDILLELLKSSNISSDHKAKITAKLVAQQETINKKELVKVCK